MDNEINIKVTIWESTKSAHVNINGVSTAIIRYVRGARFSKISGILYLYNSQKKEIAQISIMYSMYIQFVPTRNSKFDFDDIPDDVKIGL